MLKKLEEILIKHEIQFDVSEIDKNRYEFRWLNGEADMAVYADGNNLEDIAEVLYNEYENFDVDEETALWIGEDGHGKNGAPYHIRDIIQEFERYEQDLDDLWTAIKQEADK
ncbi:MAG: hypothetical protein J5965_04650 [Aeriscardovia sp.]|nr:hypothetical protein [Aeriscardovia sp.]